MELKELDFGSIEPLLISMEFLNRFSKLEKMCHHFHLSLQSGCDETLKRMNRRYTIEQFREIARMLREKFDDCILTTDIIVGFPGESEEEFQKTYEFLKEMKFYKMHIFKYSIRKGTIAEKMPNQVDGIVKEKRSNLLIELSNKNEYEYLNEYINKNIKVLFEENENGFFKGHTSNYLVAKVKSDEDLINRIIEVNVKKTDNYILYCNLK